jgi:2-hydroxy-3-keto-5-methylthiopentenyl-1-phosphate phosphatase
MGNCKCSHRRPGPTGYDILVGDGRSDFCIAQRCDLVLAKGTLAAECKTSGINHLTIRNFADAIDAIAQWSHRTTLLQQHAV